jgi:hypothetical protein
MHYPVKIDYAGSTPVISAIFMKLKNMSEIVSDKNGIECPHCKHWNLHEECGTYEVWFPICIKCGECTEVPNE